MSEFIYLGSKISSSGDSADDVRRRIALAASSFQSLIRVWSLSRLSLKTKLRIYSACVIPVLLYSSETWTLKGDDLRKLESFHMSCQRRILDVKWYDFTSNVEVRARSGLTSIEDIVTTRRLSLFGHVARLAPTTPAYKTVKFSLSLKTEPRLPSGWRRPPAALGNAGWTRLDQIMML